MSLSDASTLAIAGFVTIAISLVLLQFGYIQTRMKKYKNHKFIMLAASGINATFLVLYIIRWTTEGSKMFPGPESIKNLVYFPILITHIALSVYVVYLVSQILLFSMRNQKLTSDNTPYFEGEFRDWHRKIGKRAYLSWSISFVGGITIFFMLYIIPW